jgi:HSP20 family protein
MPYLFNTPPRRIDPIRTGASQPFKENIMNATFSVSPRFVRDPFAHVFDDLFRGYVVRPAGNGYSTAAAARGMQVDVTEEGNNYLVAADLPGLKKEDIKIEIDGAQISISAEYKSERQEKDGERLVYSERRAGTVARSFELPAEIDRDAAIAKYEDGVLKLTLPKKVAESRKLLSIH